MSLFAILLPEPSVALESAIKEKCPDNYQITRTQWIVSDKGTAQQISDKLKISTGETGSGVVLSFNGYWGRADTSLWEWMKAKIEGSENG